jgi:hypothetical protein
MKSGMMERKGRDRKGSEGQGRELVPLFRF